MSLRQQIMEALAYYAQGASAQELADVLGAQLTSVGSFLSEATWRNKVTRTTARRRADYRWHFVYHIAPIDQPEPPQGLRPVWSGKARIARRFDTGQLDPPTGLDGQPLRVSRGRIVETE